MLFRRKRPTLAEAWVEIISAAGDLPPEKDWLTLAENAKIEGVPVGDWTITVRRLSRDGLRDTKALIALQKARHHHPVKT